MGSWLVKDERIMGICFVVGDSSRTLFALMTLNDIYQKDTNDYDYERINMVIF